MFSFTNTIEYYYTLFSYLSCLFKIFKNSINGTYYYITEKNKRFIPLENVFKFS